MLLKKYDPLKKKFLQIIDNDGNVIEPSLET